MGDVKALLMRLCSKALRSFEHDFINVVRFMKQHFTWLSVIVIGIMGCILICFNSWRFRFRYYSWKEWKGEAAVKCFVFILLLVLSKVLTGGIF